MKCTIIFATMVILSKRIRQSTCTKLFFLRRKKMKKILALALCLCMILCAVACTTTPEEPETKEAEYKLGLGVVVSTASTNGTNAQVDATIAAVVTDADGKIVLCRIDVALN